MKPNSKAGKKFAADIRDRFIAAGWVKVPPGWSLVPDSPTPEQLKAASDVMKLARHPIIYVGDDDGIASNYYAMVKAAPSFAQLFEGSPRVENVGP